MVDRMMLGIIVFGSLAAIAFIIYSVIAMFQCNFIPILILIIISAVSVLITKMIMEVMK